MRPLIENVMSGISQDCLLREFRSKSQTQEFSCPWHYHTEYELMLYQNPDQRFVGNYFAGMRLARLSTTHFTLRPRFATYDCG